MELILGMVADAARNSSDWLRGFADPGLWVVAVFGVWAGASLVAGRLLALGFPTGWTQRRKQGLGAGVPGKQPPSARSEFVRSASRTFQRNVFEGRGLVLVGVPLILIGSAGWTLVGTTGATAVRPEVAALGAGLDILAVLTLAAGLALRLRLQVKVVGADGVTSPVQSSYVAARMAALGSSRPRGLLFPQGTDTANLPENALSTAGTATSKLAASILALLRVLTSVTPWKAEICLVDKQTAAVTLRRNGSQNDSALLSTATLLPPNSSPSDPDSERALLTAAAAFILFQLSRAYPKLGYGLAGAEQWQSVAAQVLATTPPWSSDPKTSAELFARAVNFDPKNLAAWLGFLATGIGSYGSHPTLRRSLPLLEKVLKELNRREQLDLPELPKPDGLLRDPLPEEALRIRVLRTLTILTNNQRLLEEDSCRKQETVRQSLEYASQLMESVRSASKPKKEWAHLNEYARRMQPLAASLYVHVWNLQSSKPDNQGWLPLANGWKPAEPGMTALATLRYHYDEACARLEESEDQHKDTALDHLELALALQELRFGAASDPSFRSLRRNHESRFASLVDNAPRIVSLNALKGHSEKLTSVGMRFASDFLTRDGTSGDENLAKTLEVPKETIAWMRGVCKLAEECPDPMMSVDWTNLLTDEGIDNPQALHALVESHGHFYDTRYARIIRNAERSSVDAPNREDLQDWDSKLAGTADSPAPAWAG